MEKINFKNKGEPGAIPANADNLNLMQNNVENEFNNISDYSTSEKKIGKWMNKNLYRKIVMINGLSFNVVESASYNISDADQVWIENAFGVSTGPGRVVTLPMVGYNGDLTSKCDIWVEKSEGVIKMFSNGGWGADWWFYVILNYTKN